MRFGVGLPGDVGAVDAGQFGFPERMGGALAAGDRSQAGEHAYPPAEGGLRVPERCAARNPQGLEVKANDRVVR